MNLPFKLIFVLPLFLLLFACKKDKNLLGVDVQPSEDALDANFSETSPVYGYTQAYDSIANFNDRYKFLGINKDPYFGISEVNMYLNPAIPGGQIYLSFGDDAQLVSSEIILTAYNLRSTYVGNAAAQVTYSVFAITQKLQSTAWYYSNFKDGYGTDGLLGAFTGSYTTLNGKIVLRIPINKDFANAVLTNPQFLYSTEAFQNTYKGFYIKCGLNNDDGTITKFDLEDEQSGFYLYYQNGSPSATKVDKKFRFAFGSDNNIRFSTLKQSFQGANSSLVAQVVNNDTTKGADNIFLKGMGVTKARIFIPNLKNYSDSFAVAVNRAEVTFNLDPQFIQGVDYPSPPILCLVPIDSLGGETYADDQRNSVDAARYGGKFNETTGQYVFNIARYAQAILSGKSKNRGFYLVIGNADNLNNYINFRQGKAKELLYLRRDVDIQRVVLAGSNNPTLKPVFKLSYIPIKKD